MPALILLNGAPASGKSTLAARLVVHRPLSLNLDIDVIRGQLGSWLDSPEEAGLAARDLALAMARTHLEAGRDVVVPQFLANETFIEQLEQLASVTTATFAEVVLVLDRDSTVEAFRARSNDPDTSVHRDAAALVQRSHAADPVGTMHDALQDLVARRPNARLVPTTRGDVEATYQVLTSTLAEFGICW